MLLLSSVFLGVSENGSQIYFLNFMWMHKFYISEISRFLEFRTDELHKKSNLKNQKSMNMYGIANREFNSKTLTSTQRRKQQQRRKYLL